METELGRPCKRLKLRSGAMAELATLEQLPNLGPDFLGTLGRMHVFQRGGSRKKLWVSRLDHLVFTVGL